MNKIKYTILLCSFITCFTSCRKYVEIPPQQTRTLTTTADYQGLMYNSNVMNLAYFYPVFSGDDAGSTTTAWQNSLISAASNVYTWAAAYYGNTEQDADWNSLYKQLYICNTVVTGVMGSQSGTQAQKQLALSDALVHRAFIYYTLVNLYATQYDAATAATDPGVPLVLQPNFVSNLTRVSVQKIYDQVLSDLNSALPGLPNLPDFNSNPSKAAVYALLARVYLNTRDFTQAEKYANSSLALTSTLLDLNAYIAVPTTIPTQLNNREEIFFKKTVQYPSVFPLSADALSLFNTKDLRYQIFTLDASKIPGATFTGRGYYRQKLANDGTYVGLSVPEMMLIKAECEARAGNTATALGVLNTLRKKRFKPADYADLTAADANTALHDVTDERKREFVGRGFWWFDQRRLSKDAGFVSTVTRVFKGATYTLEPGSNRYTYPIAPVIIQFNPEIIQNPR
ncbi:MAG: RagB/SusD protein [Ferruginibacter sp.]|nr:RagB/SusD protein [Ferruginibacter sp.]